MTLKKALFAQKHVIFFCISSSLIKKYGLPPQKTCFTCHHNYQNPNTKKLLYQGEFINAAMCWIIYLHTEMLLELWTKPTEINEKDVI